MTLYLPCRERPERFELNPRAPLANGLVFAGLGAMPGTTHYHDSSLHGNDGQLTNMTPSDDWVWIDELGRMGLDFNAGDQTVACTNLPFGSAFTISLWFYWEASTAYGGLAIQGPPNNGVMYFAHYAGNRCYLKTANNSFTSTTGPAFSVGWQHACAVYDGTQLTVYRNTIPGTPLARTGAVSGATGSFIIGDGGWVGGSPEGTVADLLIWPNRALTLPEIQALADPSNAMLSGLLLPPRRVWWPVSGGATAESAWGSIFSTSIISAS